MSTIPFRTKWGKELVEIDCLVSDGVAGLKKKIGRKNRCSFRSNETNAKEQESVERCA